MREFDLFESNSQHNGSHSADSKSVAMASVNSVVNEGESSGSGVSNIHCKASAPATHNDGKQDHDAP